jgi:predicted ferric reductase
MIQVDPLVANAISVAGNRLSTSWPWYIIRAAGFTAAGLLFLLMLSGIGQATGWTYRFMEPIAAWALHKALALALCAAIVVHVGFLLIDHFVRFSLASILVPFVSSYNNKTHFLGLPLGVVAVALGILAAYGVVIIVLSSLLWIDTKKPTWRLLHYLPYVVVVLVFFHALYSGTDLRSGILRDAWIFGGLIILLAIVYRLARAGSLKQDKVE